ncbi:hypothetical protein QBC42DRAFT_312063 [Cladorrhinum samala]|uniref:Microbial-type PARG catalytic domain-containing protein n=1 Tax=Cladorrhinum samala TaxID=585594 RepID=A0AAV9HIP5_9PEZI|nr:hypothetical protein QBC42DRAFT_312063 [Cladorrhinum samala]
MLLVGEIQDPTYLRRTENIKIPMPPKAPSADPRRAKCRAVAAENRDAYTAAIANQLPDLSPATAEKINLASTVPLDAADCPGFILSAADYPELPAFVKDSKPELAFPAGTPSADQRWFGTMVRVVDMDSFDCAISLPNQIFDLAVDDRVAERLARKTRRRLRARCEEPARLGENAGTVAVMNFANATTPGGGWMNGAVAQEEVLCYRSTLAASLRARFYPWDPRDALYTRDVVIYRDRLSNTAPYGLDLLPQTKYTDGAERLPVVSVISAAAVRNPATRAGRKFPGNLYFSNPAVRSLTKDKIRLTLRIAASKGHALVVLGAFGCGAFANPPQDVAFCFCEVMREPEFQGGWFKEIWFAVLDGGTGNYRTFKNIITRELWMCQKYTGTKGNASITT